MSNITDRRETGDFVKQTPLKTGFHPPEQCVRGRTDCRSLAQIIAEGEPATRTFMCLGELRDRDTHPEGDDWCFCHRSRHDRDYIGAVDFRIFVNRRDMSHMAAVLSMGLATVMPDELGEVPPPLDDATLADSSQ
jgi:hypothetical protein